MQLVPLVYHLPVARLYGWVDGVIYLSVEVFYYHVAGSGGAVIVEIVISVDTILGPIVIINELCNAPLLHPREVELLLLHPSALCLILHEELLEVFYAHLIVGESEHETHDEVTLRKRKHAVVDGQILPSAIVMVTYRSVSI